MLSRKVYFVHFLWLLSLFVTFSSVVCASPNAYVFSRAGLGAPIHLDEWDLSSGNVVRAISVYPLTQLADLYPTKPTISFAGVHIIGLDANRNQRLYTIDPFSGSVVFSPLVTFQVLALSWSNIYGFLLAVINRGNGYEVVNLNPITGAASTMQRFPAGVVPLAREISFDNFRGLVYYLRNPIRPRMIVESLNISTGTVNTILNYVNLEITNLVVDSFTGALAFNLSDPSSITPFAADVVVDPRSGSSVVANLSFQFPFRMGGIVGPGPTYTYQAQAPGGDVLLNTIDFRSGQIFQATFPFATSPILDLMVIF